VGHRPRRQQGIHDAWFWSCSGATVAASVDMMPTPSHGRPGRRHGPETASLARLRAEDQNRFSDLVRVSLPRVRGVVLPAQKWPQGGQHGAQRVADGTQGAPHTLRPAMAPAQRRGSAWCSARFTASSSQLSRRAPLPTSSGSRGGRVPRKRHVVPIRAPTATRASRRRWRRRHAFGGRARRY